jgi:hypothetical protein
VKSGAFDRSMEKYAVLGLPTVLFIDAYGRELPAKERVTAAIPAEELLRRLRGVDERCAVEATACLARW